MAQRYYVNRNPRRRKSSALPLIFEKIIWGFFILVAVVLVLSVLWRKTPQDNAQQRAQVSNKIIRQIPRAQLEFSGEKVVTDDKGDGVSVSVGKATDDSQKETGGARAVATDQGRPGADSTTSAVAQNDDTRVEQSPQPSGGASAMSGSEAHLTKENEKAGPHRASEASPVKEENTGAVVAVGKREAPGAQGTLSHEQSQAGRYIVRVGAFKRRENVAEIRSRIEGLGYATRTWEFNHKKLGHLFMLDLLPFNDKAAALKAKQDVEKQEQLKALVIDRSH